MDDADDVEKTVASEEARDTLTITVLLQNQIGMINILDGSIREIPQAAEIP